MQQFIINLVNSMDYALSDWYNFIQIFNNCDHIETTTQNAVNSNTEKRLLFYWQVDKVDVKLVSLL